MGAAHSGARHRQESLLRPAHLHLQFSVQLACYFGGGCPIREAAIHFYWRGDLGGALTSTIGQERAFDCTLQIPIKK